MTSSPTRGTSAPPRSRKRKAYRAKNILIAWANVAKSQPAHVALLQLCYEQEVDIIQVQEPWTEYPTKTQSHPAYELYVPVDSWTSRSNRPRVLTYTRKGAQLKVQQRRPVGSRDMLWVDVNGISLLNFYRQPRTDQVVDYLISLEPSERCVVGGDGNAYNEMWEPGINTANRGGEIAEWSRSSGMVYTGQPGVATQAAGHTLDLVFSNVPFVSTVVDESLNSGSDHQTLLTRIPGRGAEPLEQFHYRVPEDKLEDFDNLMHLSIRGVGRAREIPDGDAEAIETWIRKFNLAWLEAIQAAGKPARSIARAAPWWTQECTEAKNNWHKARRQLESTNVQEVEELRRQFLRTVRSAKRQYWRKTIDGVKTDKDLYRVVGWHKLVPKLKSPPIIVDGRQIDGITEKAQVLARHIIHRFSAEDDLPGDPLEGWEREELNIQLDCMKQASLEEVEASTIGVKSTSPGVDRTTARLLKACWGAVKGDIHALFNKCLHIGYYPKAWRLAEVVMIPKPGKKDLTTWRSYRPIALISCLGKGLERLLARRMTWRALEAKLVSPQQAGALPKRSATDLVAAFVHDAEWGLAMRQVTSILTLDVQGAFDAVLPNRLLNRMRQQGWPLATLRMVQNFLTERSVQVRLEGEVTERMPLTCGTPQGSPLSPLLYVLYLAELLNQNTKLRFGYADDIALVRTSKSLTTNVELLEQDARQVLDWCDNNKVYFAWEKSELLHISRRRSDGAPPVVINDNIRVVPVMDEPGTANSPAKQAAVRWLGIYIDRKLSFRRHIAERCGRAMKLAWHLRGLANTKYGPPATSIRKAVITCVLPTALYGAEVWYAGRTRPPRNTSQTGKDYVSTKLGEHIKQLQRVIDTAARSVLPVWKTTPTITLCRDAALPTAEVALEEVRLRFAFRLHSVDAYHPLVSRMNPPLIPRGRGAGTPHRAYTRVQLAAKECGGFSRPLLTAPRYTAGSRTDPTGGLSKRLATQKFEQWFRNLDPWDLAVFTDGSQEGLKLGYGYAILQPGYSEPIAYGKGSLDTCGVVFDAEAMGAWRGLEHAIRVAEPEANITVCVDNTASIWCLRGTPSATSQWAFLSFQEAVRNWQGRIQVKWAPGHMGIHGNELADKLAKDGLKAPRDPKSAPTLAGVKAKIKQKLRSIRDQDWKRASCSLSPRYKAWKLNYDPLRVPKELETLSRTQLQLFLAIRTGHGDFAHYHRRFRHHGAELHCTCGYKKTPEHIVMCRKVQRHFDEWPWPGRRPKVRPRTRQEKLKYLQELMENPESFQKYLKVTGFYSTICPRQ